jgi:sugar lactone lactonase YvrE
MKNAWVRNPPGQERVKTIPSHLCALAASDQNAPPEPANAATKDAHLLGYLEDLDGKKVDLWSAHSLLNPPPSPYSGFYLGVSALALDTGEKNIYAVTMGNPMVLRIPIKEDGSAGEPQALQPSGYSLLDGIVLDAKGNIYVSEVLRNEIWVLSPDGSQRIQIANPANIPLDNNSSLVLKGDVLRTANFGFIHEKPEEANRTVVCMKGFPVPK